MSEFTRRERIRLSKTLSKALRHDPAGLGIELDSEGFTPLPELLAALRRRRPEWRDLGEEDLRALHEVSDKKRFEFRDGLVRAYYGHSLAERIAREVAEPPEVLFHGTSPEAAASILEVGLEPRGRQSVHLSTERATATRVGSRKDRAPVILVVRAREAHADGVAFYHGNQDTWLADHVPARYIDPEGS